MDSLVAPKDCQSMAELRQQIDALDAALIALLVIRKRHRAAQLPAAAQNAARDHSEALKLEADGGVLQEIVSQSFSRTPNSTLPERSNGGHAYDFDNHGDEEASIEVERPKSPYMDNPSTNGGGRRSGGRRSVNEYGGNIL